MVVAAGFSNGKITELNFFPVNLKIIVNNRNRYFSEMVLLFRHGTTLIAFESRHYSATPVNFRLFSLVDTIPFWYNNYGFNRLSV